MAQVKSQLSTFVENFRNIVLTVSITAGLISGLTIFAWNTFATPLIDKRIRQQTEPIIEAIEYQNYLMMATMSDDQLEVANKRWINSRKALRQ